MIWEFRKVCIKHLINNILRNWSAARELPKNFMVWRMAHPRESDLHCPSGGGAGCSSALSFTQSWFQHWLGPMQQILVVRWVKNVTKLASVVALAWKRWRETLVQLFRFNLNTQALEGIKRHELGEKKSLFAKFLTSRLCDKPQPARSWSWYG